MYISGKSRAKVGIKVKAQEITGVKSRVLLLLIKALSASSFLLTRAGL